MKHRFSQQRLYEMMGYSPASWRWEGREGVELVAVVRRGSGEVGLADSNVIGKAMERAVIGGMLADGLVLRGFSGMTGSSLWFWSPIRMGDL